MCFKWRSGIGGRVRSGFLSRSSMDRRLGGYDDGKLIRLGEHAINGARKKQHIDHYAYECQAPEYYHARTAALRQ